MNVTQRLYKHLTLVQLITAYQRPVDSGNEREALEKEIVRRGIDLEEAKRMKVESLQEIGNLKSIDRAVLKERSLRIFWRIFWRIANTVIAVFIIIYGLQFWSWLTK